MKRNLTRLLAVFFSLSSTLAPGEAAPTKTLSLREAINLALTNSAVLAESTAYARRGSAELELSKSAFFPKAGAELEAGTIREYRVDDVDLITSTASGETAEEKEYNTYQGKVELTFNLFNGFVDLANLKKARAAMHESELARIAAKAGVISNVILTYFGILRDKRKLESEYEIKKLRERQLGDIKNRYRGGKTTDLELLQAQYALSAQQPAIRRIESQIVHGTQQLVRVTGMGLGAAVKLTDSIDSAVEAIEKVGEDAKLSELYQQALEHNPDVAQLKAAEQQLEQERVKLRGQHLPKLDFVLQAKSQAERANELGDDVNSSYSGLLQLSVPLFSGFSSFREQTSAAASVAANKAHQTLAREKMLLNLSAALQQLDLAKEEIEAQRINTKLADRAIKRAQEYYQLGKITLTDLLQAYSDRLNASQLLADALFRRIESNVTLMLETGILGQRSWQ